MQILIGFSLMIAATFLIMRVAKSIIRNIRENRESSLIIVMREFFLGASGFYFIIFLIGFYLVLSRFKL